MSIESQSTQAPQKRPPWDTLDPRIQRTAWIVGIIAGALGIISNFVIPYYELAIVFFQLALAAWYVYSWRTTKYFLLSWFLQHVFVFSLVMSFLQAGFHLSKNDGYAQLVGCLWFLSGCSWTALSVVCAYEQYTDALEHQRDLWKNSAQSTIAHLELLATAQHKMAALQAQMVEFNAVQVRLTELHHKDTTTLAENTAKHLGIDKSELLPEKTLIVGVKTEA